MNQLTAKTESVAQFFEKNKTKMVSCLPDHIKPEKMISLAMTCIKQNDKLLQCSMDTLFGALMKCSQLGLEPIKGLNQISLIPFKGSVDVVVGYNGLITLAMQHPSISCIKPVVVKCNDKFDYEEGQNPYLRHKPALSGRGGSVGYYAVAQLKNESNMFYFLSMDEAKNTMDGARNKKIWNQFFDEMAMKTAVRRLVKYLPAQSGLAGAVQMEINEEIGVGNVYTVDSVVNESGPVNDDSNGNSIEAVNVRSEPVLQPDQYIELSDIIKEIGQSPESHAFKGYLKSKFGVEKLSAVPGRFYEPMKKSLLKKLESK